MSRPKKIHYPDYKEMLQGCAGYIENEKRDAMYKVARYLITEAEWNPQELAEGVGVLLLTWNAAFYTKYGSFDFDKLENFIEDNLEDLKKYSKRCILSYTKSDDEQINHFFRELLEVLKSHKKEAITPVGTAKALHLLAPDFFSIWDTEIAKAYGAYWWQYSKNAPQLYNKFQNLTHRVINNVLKSYGEEREVSQNIALKHLCLKWYPQVALSIYSKKPPIQKSLVKMVDEYNFSKYRLKLDLDNYRDTVLKVLSGNK